MNFRKSEEDFEDVLNEQLKNPEFKKCFDEAGAEYATFKNAMEARKEAGLTQEDIAERMDGYYPIFCCSFGDEPE